MCKKTKKNTNRYAKLNFISFFVFFLFVIVGKIPHGTLQVESAPNQQDSYLKVHFIDVGQADAALLECDGNFALIDGGNKADSDKIYSVLKSAKVPKLDIIVASHAHEDHIGGLSAALKYTTADLVLSPVNSYASEAFKDLVKYADLNGGGVQIPAVRDKYDLGKAELTILGLNTSESVNNSSIVLRVDFGITSFLFTGDAEREAEQALLDSGANLAATVLKVGHHGSDTSTAYPFLRAVNPKYAVISVGKNNSYGHPSGNTLSRLRDADVEVFRTDLQGDIFCYSDGINIFWGKDKPQPKQNNLDFLSYFDYELRKIPVYIFTRFPIFRRIDNPFVF